MPKYGLLNGKPSEFVEVTKEAVDAVTDLLKQADDFSARNNTAQIAIVIHKETLQRILDGLEY